MQCMEQGSAGDSYLGKVESQLRKGVLEYCVLALMRDEPRYGVELVQSLEASGALAAGQGTIYPLLSRLRRANLVTTTWKESTSGPPRRYYRLTDAGLAALSDFARIWPSFRDAVDGFLAPQPPPPIEPEQRSP